MPIITGEITSYDVAENARDVSDLFYSLNYPETTLLNRIPLSNPVSDVRHNWWEDNLPPIATTLAANYTAASGTCTLTEAKGTRIGMLIELNADTVLRITAVNYTTGVCTVVVVANDGNQTSGDVVLFLNTANEEGSDKKDSDYTAKSEYYNVCQIISDYAEITKTQQSITREVGGVSQIDDESAAKLQRLYKQLNVALWINPRVAPSDNLTPRVMGGIPYFIAANGYAPSAAAFTIDNFDAFLLEMDKTYRAELRQAWMNPTMLKDFVALDSSAVRIVREEETTGRTVRKYQSEYGYELELITDKDCPTSKIFCFNDDQLMLRPLRGRQFQARDLPETGDKIVRELLGEYTVEVNPSQTMGVFEKT